MVQHKNYVTERKDRLSGKSGGGILCYVRENIQYKRRSDLETDLELIWLDIFISGSKIFSFVFSSDHPSQNPHGLICLVTILRMYTMNVNNCSFSEI